ncbi:PREDICTED: protein FAR-RED IMPAIRED RESPONSE 1-like [Fragaria vesca subsp. vesca]
MDASENEKQPNKGVEDVAVDVPRFGCLTIADVRALTFETVDEAERFHCAYSTVVGFGCRKDDKGESNSLIRWRQWVCCKEGTREHNHELATGNQIAFVRAHRHVSEAALALTNTMTTVSIIPCHMYKYMVEQAGGYLVVGFTMKDLYNKLDQQRRTSPFESDSEGALSYMRALAAKDPHFICRFTTDLEDRLVDIFWRDGHSFVDYQCYGDVLIFDSTYKTNVYNRLLVLFVGSNNHRGSIIFGAALISDETEETYTWLLCTFLESMNGKMPKVVLTDSDEAMRKAIETVMSEARHRLCI